MIWSSARSSPSPHGPVPGPRAHGSLDRTGRAAGSAPAVPRAAMLRAVIARCAACRARVREGTGRPPGAAVCTNSVSAFRVTARRACIGASSSYTSTEVALVVSACRMAVTACSGSASRATRRSMPAPSKGWSRSSATTRAQGTPDPAAIRPGCMRIVTTARCERTRSVARAGVIGAVSSVTRARVARGSSATSAAASSASSSRAARGAPCTVDQRWTTSWGAISRTASRSARATAARACLPAGCGWWSVSTTEMPCRSESGDGTRLNAASARSVPRRGSRAPASTAFTNESRSRTTTNAARPNTVRGRAVPRVRRSGPA